MYCIEYLTQAENKLQEVLVHGMAKTQKGHLHVRYFPIPTSNLLQRLQPQLLPLYNPISLGPTVHVYACGTL